MVVANIPTTVAMPYDKKKNDPKDGDDPEAVPYTHLTPPTNYLGTLSAVAPA